MSEHLKSLIHIPGILVGAAEESSAFVFHYALLLYVHVALRSHSVIGYAHYATKLP